jgi:hypothetical protein
MNKKPIGSRQAEEMARVKFGERAFAMRQGKMFIVGTGIKVPFFDIHWDHHYGTGKSWAEALTAVGITIPANAPYLPPTVQHMIEKDGVPDVMPEVSE